MAAADPASPPLQDVEAFLQQVIAGLHPLPPPRNGPGRPAVLPALALWTGLLVCVLRGFSSQLTLWRLLTLHGLWQFPRVSVSDEAVYKALERGGLTPLETLFANVTNALRDRLAAITTARLAPFAAGVFALDVSTLDQVRRLLPDLRPLPKGDPRLLPGKLHAVFDVRGQLWRTVRFVDNPHQNDKVDARHLAATLPSGALILADLGYFGFAWFDWLTDHGYFWVSRLRNKTSYEVNHTFYARGEVFDGIVWLGKHRADRAAHAVRLVAFPAGGQVRRYLTNVTSPREFPPRAVAEVYARRWDIEMGFQLLKQRLDLRLLWSAKPVVVRQQLLGALIVSQVLQAFRLEIASQAGVDPFEVSLPLFVVHAPYLASQGRDPVRTFVEDGRRVGFIRPSRRLVINAPELPVEYAPLPPDAPLVRTPRYAGRRC
jgi:hypothetical protein